MLSLAPLDWLFTGFVEPFWSRLDYLWQQPVIYLDYWSWNNQPYYLFLPEIFLAVAAVMVLLLDLIYGRKYFFAYVWIIIAGLMANFAMTIHLMYTTSRYFGYGLGTWWGGIETIDPYAIFFKQLLDWGDFTLLMILFAYGKHRENRTEFLVLFAIATIAFDLMVGSSDLMAIFVMTEFSSITLYILICTYRRNARSLEAALKFFLTGALSTTILLFGMALVYGYTGKTNLFDMKALLYNVRDFHPMVVASMILIIVGLAYKIGIAPFHQYVPDTYEGSPTVVTAFLAIFPKIAGFAVMMRIFLVGFIYLREIWQPFVLIMALYSILIGNVMCIKQTSFKRFMAWSGINHIGWIMLGLVSAGLFDPNQVEVSLGLMASVYYMLAYTFMTLGVFLVQMLNEVSGGDDRLETLNGLARRNVFLAGAITVCTMGLMGLPPTTGFWAKLFIIESYLARFDSGGMLFDAFFGQGSAIGQVLYQVSIVFIFVMLAIPLYYYTYHIIRRVWVLEPIHPELAKPYLPIVFQRAGVLVSAGITLLLGIKFTDSLYNYVVGSWFLNSDLGPLAS